MAQLQTRIQKLEARRPDIDPPRFTLRFVPPCPERRGVCEHIVSAVVDGAVFKRRRGETLDALTDRAVAEGSDPEAHQVIVRYTTAHDTTTVGCHHAID